MRRHLRWMVPSNCLVVVMVMIATLTGSAVPAYAEFQMRSAINDSKMEVISLEGSSVSYDFDSASAAGLTVYNLVPNLPYTITVTGAHTYLAGRGRQADAECTTDAEGDGLRGRMWQPKRWGGEAIGAYADSFDLAIKTGPYSHQFIDWVPESPFSPEDSAKTDLLSPGTEYGDVRCSKTHTYTASYVATKSYETFSLVDPWGFADNAGAMKLTFARAPFSAPRGYDCPKWQGEPWTAVAGVPDALNDPRPHHESMGPDTRVIVGEIEMADVMIDANRNPHAIPKPGALNLAQDPSTAYYPHIMPFFAQTGHDGIYTCNYAMPDTVYRIIVQGTYTYNSSIQYGNPELAQADAECSTGKTDDDTDWQKDRFTARHDWAPGVDYDSMDLGVGEYPGFQDWKPLVDVDGDGCADDPNHTYELLWTPRGMGPVQFKIYDSAYEEADNSGTLCMIVQKVRTINGPTSELQHLWHHHHDEEGEE